MLDPLIQSAKSTVEVIPNTGFGLVAHTPAIKRESQPLLLLVTRDSMHAFALANFGAMSAFAKTSLIGYGRNMEMAKPSQYIWDDNVDNLFGYINGGAAWKVVTKGKQINKTVYPRTRIPIIGIRQYGSRGWM